MKLKIPVDLKEKFDMLVDPLLIDLRTTSSYVHDDVLNSVEDLIIGIREFGAECGDVELAEYCRRAIIHIEKRYKDLGGKKQFNLDVTLKSQRTEVSEQQVFDLETTKKVLDLGIRSTILSIKDSEGDEEYSLKSSLELRLITLESVEDTRKLEDTLKILIRNLRKYQYDKTANGRGSVSASVIRLVQYVNDLSDKIEIINAKDSTIQMVSLWKRKIDALVRVIPDVLNSHSDKSILRDLYNLMDKAKDHSNLQRSQRKIRRGFAKLGNEANPVYKVNLLPLLDLYTKDLELTLQVLGVEVVES